MMKSDAGTGGQTFLLSSSAGSERECAVRHSAAVTVRWCARAPATVDGVSDEGE